MKLAFTARSAFPSRKFSQYIRAPAQPGPTNCESAVEMCNCVCVSANCIPHLHSWARRATQWKSSLGNKQETEGWRKSFFGEGVCLCDWRDEAEGRNGRFLFLRFSLWTGLNSQEVKTSKVFMKRSCCCSWSKVISSILLLYSLYVVYCVPKRKTAFRFPFHSLYPRLYRPLWYAGTLCNDRQRASSVIT